MSSNDHHEADDDDDDDDLAELRQQCPSSTTAERERFLRAKDGNRTKALEQLSTHVTWREEHGLDDAYHCSSSFAVNDDPTALESSFSSSNSNSSSNNDDGFGGGDPNLINDDHPAELWYSCASDGQTLDEIDWRFATLAALEYERRTAPSSSFYKTRPQLPQLARILSSPGETDASGHRILQFLPARMDLSKASDASFALSIALYLERKLDRNSSEKITVAIDVRGGTGWANPKPTKLLPFIRKVAALLEQHFPERLAKCVVYPVPVAAAFLWRGIRPWLDPETARKIGLVRGDSSNHAPPPCVDMEPHIVRPVLEAMEGFRCASFACSGASASWEPPTTARTTATGASFAGGASASAGEPTAAASTTVKAATPSASSAGGASASAGEPTASTRTTSKTATTPSASSVGGASASAGERTATTRTTTRKTTTISPTLIKSRKRWIFFR